LKVCLSVEGSRGGRYDRSWAANDQEAGRRAVCMGEQRMDRKVVGGVVSGLGLNGVWLALCFELVVRGVIFGWRFLQGGGWAKVRV
jgi:hypothetical protein